MFIAFSCPFHVMYAVPAASTASPGLADRPVPIVRASADAAPSPIAASVAMTSVPSFLLTIMVIPSSADSSRRGRLAMPA